MAGQFISKSKVMAAGLCSFFFRAHGPRTPRKWSCELSGIKISKSEDDAIVPSRALDAKCIFHSIVFGEHGGSRSLSRKKRNVHFIQIAV